MTATPSESGPAGGMDLLTALLDTADRRGDAAALTGPDGRTLGYRQFGRAVLSTAGRLREAGMAPGERVLFSVRPGPEGVVLALGVIAAGGTVVFADPGVGAELFAARRALAAPAWAAAESLLYAAARYGRPLARRRGLLLPDYRRLGLRHIHAGRRLPGVPAGALSARRLAAGPAPAVRPEPAPDQEALVVFTSGTTRAPKAVVHTRGSLGAGLAGCGHALRIGDGDVLHTDQMMMGIPALVAGAHWTMPPYGFAPATDPARFTRGLAGATHAFCVPADLPAVLGAVERGETELPASLRHLALGGAPVLPGLLRRAARVLPRVRFLAVYGMTEMVPVAVATGRQKLAHTGPGDLLGTPLPGVRLRTAPDGELLVSGPNLCRGYLGEPPMDEHATGDLARLENGRLVLLGRKKDMLIRGRTNIYPGLYEPAITSLPGVAEAVIVGVPDAYGDERVVLAVVPDRPRAVPDSLAAAVRAQLPAMIDTAALPDEVVVLDRIPVAGRSRKPDRAALRARLRTANTQTAQTAQAAR
ncbi:fatty-acyl-CoA synthase [Streptomyces albospinus]|uniref:Fatty-acyl-CoA synthase n=1 Tax=Streptomyces albospinus TaxID=285515 RepID=A0ABQ2VNW5_9ACTN|nr:class I adenylate-forming enzyme family protein [Streptomyces albospinus]GGV03213.1 fatty-acyl-CoA synthase [Streptomyces albospinus]